MRIIYTEQLRLECPDLLSLSPSPLPPPPNLRPMASPMHIWPIGRNTHHNQLGKVLTGPWNLRQHGVKGLTPYTYTISTTVNLVLATSPTRCILNIKHFSHKVHFEYQSAGVAKVLSFKNDKTYRHVGPVFTVRISNYGVQAASSAQYNCNL